MLWGAWPTYLLPKLHSLLLKDPVSVFWPYLSPFKKKLKITMFINYHYSKTLIFRNRPYKEEEQEVELNFEKKSRFKCYPFVILLLIYATFHGELSK